MSYKKWTKEPFAVREGKAAGFVVYAVGAPKCREIVAQCGGQNKEANANLLGASKELYDALEKILSWIDPYSMPDCESKSIDVNQALTALAKARGEQQ